MRKLICPLIDWAKEDNISHAALDKLLSILQPVMFDSPKSSRRLLNTPRNYETKLNGGFYLHVGIAHNLLALFDNSILVPNSIVNLQINVDGLLLF